MNGIRYSQGDVADILQRHKDADRQQRNFDCMMWSGVSFLAACALWGVAWMAGWLP